MAKYLRLKVICDACCHASQAHIRNRAGKGKSAGGVIFLDVFDNVVSEFSMYLGEITPPQAEYSTLIKALDKASAVCRGSIEVWLDSEFVVRQLNGDYGIKSENMKPLYHEVKKLEDRFNEVKYFHHRSGANLAKRADRLAEQGYKRHQT